MALTDIGHAAGTLCFAMGSCRYPQGLLDGTPHAFGHAPGPAGRSQRRLLDRLQSGQGRQPLFVLLTGDQVYVDATAGLLDPRHFDDRFRAAYAAGKDFLHDDIKQHLTARLNRSNRWDLQAAYCLMDDHEIGENWEPLADPATPGAAPLSASERAYALEHRRILQRGRAQYAKHQRLLPGAPARCGDSESALWQTIDVPGVPPFFLADTRTERWHRDPRSVASASIMSKSQFGKLLEWLNRQHEKAKESPKFIASSSIFLPRRLSTLEMPSAALRSDAWDGYPSSLHGLLAAVCERGVRHCAFLSGDEHLACVAKVRVRRLGNEPKEATLLSVHTGAIHAPFPFANAMPEEFAEKECFEFAVGETPEQTVHYECEVRAEFAAPGDGYTLVEIDRCADGGAPQLHLEFDREGESVVRHFDWR